MRHTISVLVQNEFGVLARVAGLFSGRGFNIEALSVGETLDPKFSRMTIVTTGDDAIIEQITKQLGKLINVVTIEDLTGQDFLERELLLIKVNAESSGRAEVLRIVDIFRAKVVDASHEAFTIEITGDKNKMQAFINLLEPIGILEVVRTGQVAIKRAMTMQKGKIARFKKAS